MTNPWEGDGWWRDIISYLACFPHHIWLSAIFKVRRGMVTGDWAQSWCFVQDDTGTVITGRGEGADLGRCPHNYRAQKGLKVAGRAENTFQKRQTESRPLGLPMLLLISTMRDSQLRRRADLWTLGSGMWEGRPLARGRKNMHLRPCWRFWSRTATQRWMVTNCDMLCAVLHGEAMGHWRENMMTINIHP